MFVLNHRQIPLLAIADESSFPALISFGRKNLEHIVEQKQPTKTTAQPTTALSIPGTPAGPDFNPYQPLIRYPDAAPFLRCGCRLTSRTVPLESP